MPVLGVSVRVPVAGLCVLAVGLGGLLRVLRGKSWLRLVLLGDVGVTLGACSCLFWLGFFCFGFLFLFRGGWLLCWLALLLVDCDGRLSLLPKPPGAAEEARRRPGDAFQLVPVPGGRHSSQERRDVAGQRQARDLELRHVAPELRALTVPARTV